jgi:hypothetical protein
MTPVGFISPPNQLAIYELTWSASGSNLRRPNYEV